MAKYSKLWLTLTGLLAGKLVEVFGLAPDDAAGIANETMTALGGWGQPLKELVVMAIITGLFVYFGPANKPPDDKP